MLNWAYNLDMLAQNGVLDFDAPSFIMGQNPRYVGSPSTPPSPYVGQIPSAPALNQPPIDEFKPQKQKAPTQSNENKDLVKTATWKKWAFGALALGTVIFGACKFKSISKWVKTKFNNINWENTKNFIKNTSKSIGNFFKNGWNKFCGLFKSTKP